MLGIVEERKGRKYGYLLEMFFCEFGFRVRVLFRGDALMQMRRRALASRVLVGCGCQNWSRGTTFVQKKGVETLGSWELSVALANGG
jgi:hypothetical protein